MNFAYVPQANSDALRRRRSNFTAKQFHSILRLRSPLNGGQSLPAPISPALLRFSSQGRNLSPQKPQKRNSDGSGNPCLQHFYLLNYIDFLYN
jgi:hypothetical protein